MMKLYSSPTSPYARKVRILIVELGLESDIEIINRTPMENPADLLGPQPLHGAGKTGIKHPVGQRLTA